MRTKMTFASILGEWSPGAFPGTSAAGRPFQYLVEHDRNCDERRATVSSLRQIEHRRTASGNCHG